MDQILQILSGNARMDVEKIAVMLDLPVEEVQARISEYERQGVIRGYKPLLDYDKIDTELVEAIIEVRVSPQRDFGFEEIARTISEYNEVSSEYLMSGGYDLHNRV
ncbi:MAG: Lrp/AsnC family transcriptional regulator, partial [Oscillospiraceae bacterium]|nr:Lrp/AsnC family transcriptional regulator [Oscillospiraceae bacterium]